MNRWSKGQLGARAALQGGSSTSCSLVQAVTAVSMGGMKLTGNDSV